MVTTCKIYPYIQYDRQCTYKCNTEARSCNHCCHGKALNITYSECVSVALVIQQAKHTGYIILSLVVCLALSYFSTLSHKWHDFQEQVIEHKMNVLIFSTTFVWNVSHSKKWVSEMLLQMYIGNHVKYLLFLSDFNETCLFWEIFEKYISNFVKAMQWEPNYSMQTHG